MSKVSTNAVNKVKVKAAAAPQVKVVTLDDVRRDSQVIAYLKRGAEQMALLGFTEHGERHASLVASIARNILLRLGLPERQAQLAEIAGYLHDIGNVIHRENHAHSGAFIAQEVLERLGMDFEELSYVIAAIGNHEEERGDPVSPISAAVIIADKADVHRSRVQNPDPLSFDIHDRVNYSAKRSFVRVDAEKRTIAFEVDIDTSLSQVMEYFEIFMTRMLIARRAVRFLGCKFQLRINDIDLF